MSRTVAIATSAVLSLVVHAAVIAILLKKPARSDALIEIDPAPALTGETFEVPAANAGAWSGSDKTTGAWSGSDTTKEEPVTTQEGTTETPPRSGRASRASHGSAAVAPPVVYGAVGERGAVDVVVAFGRAISQVMSADPEWVTIVLGDKGAVDVTFAIDDRGSLFQTDVGPTASSALRRGVERTVAFVGGRTFTAASPVVHLRVSARVSPDVVHDGLHGDVFALGASGDGHTAFFALSIGRRIDIGIDVIK